MESNILLDIKGGPVSDGEESQTQLYTRGRRFDGEGALCIEYEESALSGCEGAMTTVRVEQDRVSLIRSGGTQGSVTFEKGRRCIHQFQTPEGLLELGVFPLKLDVDMGQTRGHVRMEYQLDVNGCFTGTHSLDITYRAVP